MNDGYIWKRNRDRCFVFLIIIFIWKLKTNESRHGLFRAKRGRRPSGVSGHESTQKTQNVQKKRSPSVHPSIQQKRLDIKAWFPRFLEILVNFWYFYSFFWNRSSILAPDSSLFLVVCANNTIFCKESSSVFWGIFGFLNCFFSKRLKLVVLPYFISDMWISMMNYEYLCSLINGWSERSEASGSLIIRKQLVYSFKTSTETSQLTYFEKELVSILVLKE